MYTLLSGNYSNYISLRKSVNNVFKVSKVIRLLELI